LEILVHVLEDDECNVVASSENCTVHWTYTVVVFVSRWAMYFASKGFLYALTLRDPWTRLLQDNIVGAAIHISIDTRRS